MLWAAISLICLSTFSIVKSQTTTTANPCTGNSYHLNTGENNYAVDIFANTLLAAFAIGKCSSADFIPGEYRKYTCMDMNGTWVVQRDVYSTADCSGTAVDTTTFKDTDASYTSNFKCDGENTYGSITLSIDSSCSVTSVLYVGLAACLPNGGYFTQFYCGSDTVGNMNFFLTDAPGNATTTEPYEYCDERLYCFSWNLGSTCTQIAVKPLPIYGFITECKSSSSASTTSTTKSDKSGAVSVSFSILALVSSLVVALLY